MSRQMTVGKRIGVGFSVVTLIAVTLGGLGVWSMLSAKCDSMKLAGEYVPEVKVATDLRGAASDVMYEMRGYGLAEEASYYQAAQKEMSALGKHIEEASDLANRAVHLQALKGQVTEAKDAVDVYASLMRQTEETIVAMDAERKKLDQNAVTYMQNCAEFLKGQNEAFKSDLDDRQTKVELVTAIVNRGAAARVQNFRAQGSNDMTLLQEAIKLVRGVDEELGQLRPITREQVNLDQMKSIEAAATKYADAMQAYLETNAAMTASGDKMNKNAAAYMENCAAFLTSQNEAMNNEFAQGGANLQARHQKITLINQVIQTGNEVRVMNFRAQTTQDPELMRKAVDRLTEVKEIAKELRGITQEPEGIRQIDTIEAAGATYGQAMQEYLTGYLGLDAIRKEMDASAGAYVANCDAFLRSQQEALTKDMHERHEKITLVNDIVDLGNSIRIKAFQAQALRSPELVDEALKAFPKLDEKYAALRAITRLDADLQRIAKTKAAGDGYGDALKGFLAQWQKLQSIGQQRVDAGQRVIDACNTTANAGMSATDEIAKQSAASLSTNSTIMILTLVIGTVLSIVFAVWITRSILGPLNRIINGLSEGADQVSSASSQVSAASQSLAEGATEQAAGLEETSSSLEEMSSMTKQNADNAQQANTLAAEAKKAAATGAESMSRMNAAIQEIQRSSDETAKIIKVIDEIAFQTNLLALNAAVEAARAGEAGKGFAVVAEEVRNLAMRSAEAAKNTASMIEESVKNSKNGVDIATEVSKVLEEIVQSVGKTTDLVSEIAAASQEQAQGIDQVNTAVSQMDKVTQQNAANAEESASASEELSAQAVSTNEIVAQLAALVGGARTQTAHSGESKAERHHLHLNLEHKLHSTEKPKSKSQGFGKSDEVLHKIADHAGKPQRPTAKPASKVIPLGEDTDMDRFNN